jgi:metal-dependent amidase/aminoacylase/carboxypeptidase family protein
MAARIEAAARGAAALHGLEAEVRIYGYLPPTCNSAAALARDAVGAAGLPIEINPPPSMAAEDFGTLLEKIPGAYVWIGNGSGHGLHSPEYDFNDRILAPAARFLAAAARTALAA